MLKKSIFFIFCLCVLSACMRVDERRPSRIAIVAQDGQELKDLTVTPGMTYRLYPGVFSPTFAGESYKGLATQDVYLSDLRFNVVSGTSILSVGQEGCLSISTAASSVSQTGEVELTAHALAKGQLSAMATIFIKSTPQLLSGPVMLGTFTDFSVSQYQMSSGETLYGILTQDSGTSNNVRFQIMSPTGARVYPQVAPLAADSGSAVRTWSDSLRANFYLGFGVLDPAESKWKPAMVTYSVLQADKQATALGTVSSSSELQKIKKIYGGQFNGAPVLFSLLETDTAGQHNIYIYTAASGATPGPVEDPLKLSGSDKNLGIGISATENVDHLVRFKMSASGSSYFLINDKSRNPNTLRLITLSDLEGLTVEEISGSEHDQARAFALDVSNGIPKIVFVNGGRLYAGYKQAGKWVINPVPLGNADPLIVPTLQGSEEDGSLVAVWGLSGKYRVNISHDGGISWSLSNPYDMSPSTSATSQLKMLSMPCGGGAMVTVEGQALHLRTINFNYTTAYDKVLVQNPNPISKIEVFKDNTAIRIFFIDTRGVHLVSIP